MYYQLRKCRLKIEKFTDVYMTGGMHVIQTSVFFFFFFFQFSTYMFSVDITPEKLKRCSFTQVKEFFLVPVYVFNFDLFEFSAAILEKGLLESQ